MEQFPAVPRSQVAEPWPALRALGLEVRELEAVGRQGYLSRRPGGGGGDYWRLRFRLEGRLRTVYVGSDVVLVAAVRRELAELRGRRTARRRRRALVAGTQRNYRAWKRRAGVLLAPFGLHFHWNTLRKVRSRPAVEGNIQHEAYHA